MNLTTAHMPGRVTILGKVACLLLATSLVNCVQAQEKKLLDLGPASTSGTTATPTPQGLEVRFGHQEAWPNVSWKAAAQTLWDWSGHEALVFHLTNPGNEVLSFHVKVNDIGRDDKKKATQFSGLIPPGTSGRYYLSLQPRSLREKSGMRALPPLTGDYGTQIGTGIEPDRVEALQIFRARPAQDATLLINSLTLEGPPPQTNLDGIIDRYGQYTRADWPGKVKQDADLLAAKAAEEADLARHPVLPGLSPWGGWKDGPRQTASGYFRTQFVDGRWWLVDPDGYLFLSTGIDVIRPDVSTVVAGREAMFTWLPQAGEPLAKHRSPTGRNFNFLTANLERKYGVQDAEAFGDLAVKRLRSWGFNSIGNWTPEKIGHDRRFPYVAPLSPKGTFATVAGHRGGRMPDPFDTDFEKAVEEGVAGKVPALRNDPALIGYFFDNELPWGMPSVDNERYALAIGTLAAPATSPAKRAFLGLLRQRYQTVEAFNAAWKQKLPTWAALEAPYTLKDFATAAVRTDCSDFLTLYADKYFQVVSSSIKRHDPNHLYLGCRFAYWFTPEAVRSSAKYSDVLSFNIYTWNPATYRFAQELGKPCLVGEFHFGARDSGMFTGNITVKDQAERGTSYAKYVQDLLTEPAFVGCHWFQYYDQPTTGRGQDGENFNIGFLSITDAPYRELINAARQANALVYKWHQDAKPLP